VTSTYTSYNLIARDLPRSIERIASQPQVARESEYYLKRISEIKSIDEFMADTRVFNYAMKAHGLEDMNYAKAFMRKVLTEGVDKEDAFANQLADSKYKRIRRNLQFCAQRRNRHHLQQGAAGNGRQVPPAYPRGGGRRRQHRCAAGALFRTDCAGT
jgi:hypothetical protein